MMSGTPDEVEAALRRHAERWINSEPMVLTVTGDDRQAVIVEMSLRSQDRVDVEVAGTRLGSIRALPLAAWLMRPNEYIDIMDGDVRFSCERERVFLTLPNVTRLPLAVKVVNGIQRYLNVHGVIADDY